MLGLMNRSRQLCLAIKSVAIGFSFWLGTMNGISQEQPPRAMESMQELSAKLSPEQKQKLDTALNSFGSKQYGDALAGFQSLLTAVPGDALLSKFAAEAALNTGDAAAALAAVKPIAQADPKDWQAAALLVRSCAETGDKGCRDAGMAHMKELFQQGVTPNGMQSYLAEQIKVGDKKLAIRTSLEPWGPYKIYDLGQVSDGSGNLLFRITIESGDGDQAFFKQEHPKEAAQGLRSFSMDGYQDTGLNSAGQHTQTHFTFKFFEGEPSYDTVRQGFIDVVNGKNHAITNRTGLTAQ
jgi:hypothetical protein